MGGLPGIILQAESEDGRVKYTFHSYEPNIEDKIEIDKPDDGIDVTYEEFRDIRIRSLKKVEAASGATHNDPPANFEIEKDKWNIYSSYKKDKTKRQE